VPLRGRVRAATVATAALICAVAALAASLPPAIAWASTGAQIPASALINDLKLAGAVGVDTQAAPVITPPTIMGVTLGRGQHYLPAEQRGRRYEAHRRLGGDRRIRHGGPHQR
jgi:hypothetical protein